VLKSRGLPLFAVGPELWEKEGEFSHQIKSAIFVKKIQ
jgi:hypothetical protein